MTEAKELLGDFLDKIVSEDINTVRSRIVIIQQQLEEIGIAIKKKIPEGSSNEEILANDDYKLAVIVANILNNSYKDPDCEDINKMLYYLYENSNGIVGLLSNFGIESNRDEEGNITEFILSISEEENE